MSAEDQIQDDPAIRRVAEVRPSIPGDDLSPDGRRAQAILERVLAGSTAAPNPTPTPTPRSRGRWTRPRWALPRLGLALAPVAAAIVLLLAGTFSGPDDSGTQPAAASVIRAAVRALDSTGTILVQDQTYVSGPSVHEYPYSQDQVQETPNGPGPQDLLTTYTDPSAFGQRSPVTGWAYVGGEQAFYSRKTNTIYRTSIWGPYLHPGPRPGTFVYRYASGAPAFTMRPVSVTAAQRRALLSGRDAIRSTSRRIGDKVKILGLKVLPALRAPGYAQTVREELNSHLLRYVGRATVDGRAALELTATKPASRFTAYPADEHLYLDPTTHLPFEEVDHPGTARQQVIHLRLLTLPINRANERLLSLRALHPSARIDRNFQDYLRAAHGTQFYTQ